MLPVLRQSVRVGGVTFLGLRNARTHDFADEHVFKSGFVAQRNGCGTLLLRREGARKWRRVRVAFGARCRAASS